jgi:Fe-S-cluster-containing dehydrogenase component/DMSO reductase anchor subunit
MQSVSPVIEAPLDEIGDGHRSPGGLIDALLVEQGDLTAVERFAQIHEDRSLTLRSRYYSSLVPARAPGPGQHYAFEVDLDRCTGCKACVAACHSLNGLDDDEAWREVGLIVGGPPNLPVLQHVTSACHHCLDPACLNACPVDAYEKDPVTGIVKHLDDQCFGCRYCTLACPYDAPKFHAGKGIVRKCDMCSDRLEAGEVPACVQGCPSEAIRIRLVERADIVAIAEANGFLASAPDPSYTLPTTRYVSHRPLQGPVRAADHHRIEPEHAHVPLVVMLVLTQASVGGFLADIAARLRGVAVPALLPALSLALGLTGIGASLLHLGRPQYAYRALIGLRHSWLSREVAAFGLFVCLGMAHVAAVRTQPDFVPVLSGAAAAAGIAAVFCSVMVYHVVRRPFWTASSTGTKFAGTTVLLGLAAATFTMGGSKVVTTALVATLAAKVLLEASVLSHLRDPRVSPLRRTALLLCGPLARISLTRLVLGLAGGIGLPLAFSIGLSETYRAAALAALAALLGGEFAERYLFFAAVVRPKMPGGLSS